MQIVRWHLAATASAEASTIAPAATRGATLAGLMSCTTIFEPGLDEIERHRPAHIAKPDKTNGPSHRLPPQ
jgi:hypothetical protein